MADEELISLINGTDDNDKDDDKLSTQESADYQVTCKELVDLINKNDILEAIKERFDDIFGLVKALKSSTTNGIVTNPEELNTRKKIFGTNSIEQKPPKSIYRHIWEALSDTVLQILILCALISLIISFAIKDLREECIEGFAILFAVVIVTIVTALNNWQKEKQFLQLHKKINNEHVVSVVRNGIVVKLPLSELLVGDVCLVHNGDIVPADGILLEGNDLKVDESSLTGESQLVSKSKETPALLSGTRLMEGTGKYIITAVGVNSKSGSIMLLLGTSKESCEKKSELSKKDFKKQKKENREKDKSILQKKLAKLTIMVGWIGIFAAIVTVCVLILHFCIEHYYRKKEHWSNNHLMSYLRFIILGVTIMIVAIPEGLPLAVTISLAYSVKKMLVDNNLVRHLNACETMGRATTICSDKTGTLTTNRMTVVESYIQGFHYKQIPTQGTLKEEFLDLFCQCVSINSNYESRIKPPITLPSSVALSVADNGYYDQIGNKTECALLGFVLKLGKTYQQYRDQVSENNFIHVYTFNSNRKSMSTVINKPGGGFRMFSKGAAEILLEKCTQIINKDGNVEVLYKTDVDKLNQTVIVPMASNGLRIICIAYRDFPIDVNPDWKNEPSVLSDLICMAIVGIEDPIRPEVPSAIKKCQKAGITVRMITGDNISTAQSIAIKCGILEPNSNYLVIEGRDFNSKIRDDKGQIQQNLIDDLWPRIRVMARSSPEDKYNLVKGMIDSKLNYYGEVVAVTGDGTNDAPALKIADVGFAMGIQGTEVAKEASDIILTDDNFQSIVKAVMWGRNVYDSISKFIQFQLTVNLTAIFVSIIGSTTLSVSPLSAIQLLWVNLIMDSFASLALATEDPTDALLERKPYGRTKPLISRSMFRFILGHGLYQLVVMLVLIFYGHTLFKIPNGFDNKNHLPSEHLTILFNVFVMMQVFNEINARMVHGERNVFKNIFSSKLFIFIVVGTFVVQIFLVQFGGQAFSASPLNLNQWAWCLFIGYCELLWGQLIVTIPTAIKFKQRKKILFHK